MNIRRILENKGILLPHPPWSRQAPSPGNQDTIPRPSDTDVHPGPRCAKLAPSSTLPRAVRFRSVMLSRPPSPGGKWAGESNDSVCQNVADRGWDQLKHRRRICVSRLRVRYRSLPISHFPAPRLSPREFYASWFSALIAQVRTKAKRTKNNATAERLAIAKPPPNQSPKAGG